MLKYGILGLLCDKPATGYEINETFRDSLRFFWKATTSQIYRELNTLENKGFVQKEKIEQKGKPDKNVFSITSEGKTEFLNWLSNGDLCLEQRVPVLLKVFFLGLREPQENIEFFKNIKNLMEQAMQALEPVSGIIQKYGKDGYDSEKIYWQMTLDYGLRRMQMEKEWAEACMKKIMENENECTGD